jgi:hypothetical protein
VIDLCERIGACSITWCPTLLVSLLTSVVYIILPSLCLRIVFCACLCLLAVPSHAQLPHHAGRLTVLLDLDGTLVSSFTPRRAPRLPPAMKSHLVGVGSSLNPGGVFVVERPGLHEFLQQLAGMAEVVVFTAGMVGVSSCTQRHHVVYQGSAGVGLGLCRGLHSLQPSSCYVPAST